MEIRKIERSPKIIHAKPKPKAKRKVAAYVRVSTDTAEQEVSFDAQCDYYEKYIKLNDEWTFVGIYYDNGISGLSSKNRDGFNKMITDALDGKIDLIITKSLSRFARNTVDALINIRKLKSSGVEVFFQKENIYTLDSNGEFLLTLLSSMAQEESRSMSENISWGQRRRFAKGKYSVPYKNFLGYDRGDDDTLVINDGEAKIVRLIYKLFLFGLNESAICKYLEGNNIPTPSGLSKWHKSTVKSILTNEKYKGDALLTYFNSFDVRVYKCCLSKQNALKNSYPLFQRPDYYNYCKNIV